ncbi:MAG: futalosine hydrolase [Bacteroidetes bacterium]|nr:futalosine hydrolase [Bacteroidota bacterium]HET6245693.1 futalosine hydrolase [Bacteroidia bacterium]
MIIIIVVATEKEISPLLNNLKLIEVLDRKLRKYTHNSLTIYILVTGIGMVATAYECARVFGKYDFDLALNLGIAGTFNSKVNKGEVVEIISDVFSELGAQDDDKFISLPELGLMDENEFPFTNNKLININKVKNPVIGLLQKVESITVNLVHGEKKSIEKTINQYNAQTESMEGAAFFYSCFESKIPCIQIRSISNFIEKRNRASWDIPLAVKNLNETAFAILNAF